MININLVNLAGFEATSTEYSNFKITNGYGMIAKAGVEVTKGVEAIVDVEFKMQSIATQDFKQWLDKNKSYYSKEQWHKLEENYAAGGFMGGVMAGAFGMLFGAGSYNHYKNEHNKVVEVHDNSKEGFLKSLHNVTTTNTTVTGKLHVIGQSEIPTIGCVYVEVTTINFKDGTSKTVVNSSNPIIADKNGNTSGF